MANRRIQSNTQRSLMELDHVERWLCRGRGRIAIENIRPLRVALTVLLHLPGVRRATEQYARNVRMTNYVWEFKRLPSAFSGFKILHLSDLHIDGIDGLSASVLDAISGITPDVILFTGDYRFETYGSDHLMLQNMEKLVNGLPPCEGIFGILGNHDSSEFIEPFEAMGIRMLVNESFIVKRGTDRIALLGLDDCHYYGTDDLDAALADVDPHLFKLLMVHSPELFQEANQANIDFYLCGHTHGGQIRLPIFGAPIMNAACPRRYTDRSWKHGTMQGFTHRGTGSSCVPLRFNCPPEATLHTLKTRG